MEAVCKQAFTQFYLRLCLSLCLWIVVRWNAFVNVRIVSFAQIQFDLQMILSITWAQNIDNPYILE